MEKEEYTFSNYDPDIELSGRGDQDHGHNLAENVRVGSKNIEYFLKHSPGKIKALNYNKNLLKGELGRLKKAGYSVGDYSNMNKVKMWNKYISILKENNYFR